MDNLLEDIETYLKARAMKPSTFGRKAINDPAFVSRLRSGRDVKLSTINAVRKFMIEN